MTPEFAAFLGQFGLPISMLVVVLTTGARGMWVWGRELHKAEAQAVEWRTIALRALNVSEKATKGVVNGE